MKSSSHFPRKRGFTLIELMVAMAITAIIVSVLVSVTSIALDTWNRSRSELRASRQAKTLIDTIARDFESLVTRRGNTNEWLSAVTSSEAVGTKIQSSNASELIFFTAVTDRYDGQIGTSYPANVGDVSCVAYSLEYKDPVNPSGSQFKTFVLNRKLVNPDETFRKLLGKDDLVAAFSEFKPDLKNPESFVCENVFQFSVTFHVQVSQATGSGASATTKLVDVPVTIGQNNSGQTSKSFKLSGSGIDTEISGGTVTPEELAAGRLTSMEISVTVISDFGIDRLRTQSFSGNQQSEFLAKNSYEYTKMVQLSSM